MVVRLRLALGLLAAVAQLAFGGLALTADPPPTGRVGTVDGRRPRRRRLDDVGDDWRSLLLGAPPAAA